MRNYPNAFHLPWRVLAWLGLFGSLAIVWILAAAPRADAEDFCGVTLAPYGQGGDRCWGQGHVLYDVIIVTHERAGCVDVANTNNELLQSWTCISSGNSTAIWMTPEGRRKGVVRNNNLSASGYFGANEGVYAP